ncbi:hypothetical protein ACFV4S_12290, partial [Streptomyces sp. NPDC059742]
MSTVRKAAIALAAVSALALTACGPTEDGAAGGSGTPSASPTASPGGSATAVPSASASKSAAPKKTATPSKPPKPGGGGVVGTHTAQRARLALPECWKNCA